MNELTGNLQEYLSARGISSGEKETVALQFATKIVRERGWVRDEDVIALRQAGFDDCEVVEIVAVTVLNIFTNYFNHIAETEIDFPLVQTASAVAA